MSDGDRQPSGGDKENSGSRDFSVVGIGASAGGLEACSALLKNLPLDTGFAYVVVQHLDPSHESLLPALLARVTKLPVEQVKADIVIQPNRVYVIPPNAGLALSDGLLRLVPREKPHGGSPIDDFFLSLAETHQHRAIGVILSGTGSDGAVGLDSIKSEGGLTFAQDVATARFDGMPQSAFATGSVDFVLSPEGIARELARIATHPYAERSNAVPTAATRDRKILRRIIDFLHKTCGIDFSQYRSNTIQRRILRRMAVRHIADPENYRLFLETTPTEVELLCAEMIPRVTRFFRDPACFEALRQSVFPALVKNRPDTSPVRVWVPGCASGEEAYAIAISLLEFFGEAGVTFPLQIFGTDLSALGIQTARQGLYPAKIAEDVSPERLQRFFVKREKGYQIGASVRESCVFAGHDLLNDPPYSKLDLISCRNVLIYFDSLQTRIIPMFHYALKPEGFLMLGIMETARRFGDLFTPVDKRAPLYRRKGAAVSAPRIWSAARPPAPVKGRPAAEIHDDADIQKRADRLVLARYAPNGVVVNERLQVIHVRGKVSPFLELAPGKMSVNVLGMARRSGLSLDLAAALEEAKAGNAAVRREGIRIPYEEQSINLQVVPMSLEGESRAFLILFENVPREDAPGGAEEKAAPDSDFARLQEDLSAARRRLSALLDSHQQFTEETQAAEEEGLSNLEEVQSINEELETAKEELQSTNEELSTVNEELQTRNTDLQTSRDFASSIVETVPEPLLVLDRDHDVKLANRRFYETFQIAPMETENRSFFDLAKGAWDVPEIRSLLAATVSGEKPDEDLELELNFGPLGKKALLVNARRIAGGEMILLSLEDVTIRKNAEAEMRRIQTELRQGQKMEAIGRLAGGVAHDFNNLLTGILGFSDLLLDALSPDTEEYQQAQQIKKAGERAAALTNQLLAFSRRQVLHPQVLDLNAVIVDLDKMLRRLIGEDIDLAMVAADDLWPVRADSGQIGQVVLNLSLNARDAMPHGGVLTIRTENTRVGEREPAIRGLAPGEYVTLAVSDSGSGMDLETQQHLFEPFFTTKPQGSGTGLGLATVFGIVEQSGGKIHFTTAPEQGTTFWIDFPKAEAPPAPAPRIPGGAVTTGSEVVLVVEDEELVRSLTVRVLRRAGYTVLEAPDGHSGLAILRNPPSAIDLLLTDVVMPGGLNGRQLSEEAMALRPGIKVLLMSGNTDDALVHYGVKKGTPFLQKPFSPQQLAQKVHDVLESKLRKDQ